MHQSTFDRDFSTKIVQLWQQAGFPSPLRLHIFKKKSQFAKEMDRKHLNSKQAFASVRGAPKAPVDAIVAPFSCNAAATWSNDGKTVELSHQDLDSLQVANPILVNGVSISICQRSPSHVTVVLQEPLLETPSVVLVTQNIETRNASEIAAKLTAF